MRPNWLKRQVAATAIALGMCLMPVKDVQASQVYNTRFEKTAAKLVREYVACEKAMFVLPGFLGGLGLPSGVSSLIVGVQSGTITLGPSATSNTTSISSVNTTNATIHMTGLGGNNGSTTNYPQDMAYVYLVNATTVGVVSNTAYGSAALEIGWCVIEWASAAVQSVQRGSITLTGVASNTTSISSVTTANSVLLYCGHTSTTNSDYSSEGIRLTFASATSVQGTRQGTSGNRTVYFSALEFKSAVIDSIQNVTAPKNASSASGSVTISAVDMSRTWLVWGGKLHTTVSAGWTYHSYFQLTSTTNIAVTADSSATGTQAHSVGVIQFKTGLVKSISRGVVNITGTNTTASAGLSATVTTSKTAATICGFTNEATTHLPYNQIIFQAPTTTTLPVKRYRSTSLNSWAGFDVVEFM